MEILQTIWTALTTPNERLVQLFGVPFIFIEMTVTMLLFITILNIQSTKKQKILYVIVLSCLAIFLNGLIPNPYATILHFIIWPILIMIIFKTTLLKSIIAEILPIFIPVLIETLFIRIYTLVFNITYNDLSTIPIYRETFVLFIYLSIYLLYRLAMHFDFNITILDYMDKKPKITLIINSIFCVIAIITQLYLINYYNDTLPFFITLSGTFCFLIYFIMSMYSLIRTTELEVIQKNLEEAQLYNKSLKILHDNVRAFKHDFSNIVQAIGRVCIYKRY